MKLAALFFALISLSVSSLGKTSFYAVLPQKTQVYEIHKKRYLSIEKDTIVKASAYKEGLCYVYTGGRWRYQVLCHELAYDDDILKLAPHQKWKFK